MKKTLLALTVLLCLAAVVHTDEPKPKVEPKPAVVSDETIALRKQLGEAKQIIQFMEAERESNAELLKEANARVASLSAKVKLLAAECASHSK